MHYVNVYIRDSPDVTVKHAVKRQAIGQAINHMTSGGHYARLKADGYVRRGSLHRVSGTVVFSHRENASDVAARMTTWEE